MRFWRGLHALDGLSVCYCDAWETAHPDEPGHTFTRGRTSESPTVEWLGTWAGGSTTSWSAATRTAQLDIVSSKRIFDQPVDGVWASDHFGVISELEPR
jgi:hypothetical protein